MIDLNRCIGNSKKDVQILSLDKNVLESIEKLYDIKPQSTFGYIVYNTGGIVIDNWIRLYGAGKMNLIKRNHIFPYDNIVVGEDVLGGLFIVLESGNIAYFAPDTLEVEDMEITYNQFVYWCIEGDTDTFYQDYRWKNWKEELRMMGTEDGVSFYPYLWAKADSIETRSRKKLPIKEIIELEFRFREEI